jgi:hypothetical protein
MLSGDDLAIALFLLAAAISVAGTAMNAAGYRQPLLVACLFGLAVICAAAGLGWSGVRTLSPTFTNGITQIATDPWAWFFLLVIGMGAVLILPRRQPALVRSTHRSKERTFIDIDTDYLIGLYKNRPSIQGDALSEAYIGKWVRVSGIIREIATFAPTKQISVHLQMQGSIHLDALFFNESWRERISVGPLGGTIRAIGRIAAVSSSSVRLEDCELVD